MNVAGMVAVYLDCKQLRSCEDIKRKATRLFCVETCAVLKTTAALRLQIVDANECDSFII